MNSLGPTLETARLVLRPPQAGDFDAWARLMADGRSARFIGGVQVREVAWRGFLTMVGAWAIQGFGMFSVLEKASGRWLGRLGPWQPVGWPGPEVGWALLPEAWGHGYATEGAVAAMDFAFDVLGWDHVIHTIEPANAPSQAVAQRLGSKKQGAGQLPPPHHATPVDICGQTRAQWCARRVGESR
ncbi:MAG TPA: GNAT family N-acetyltransferase [Rhodanobacteraceae bacterium]